MATTDDRDYASRKFIATLTGMSLGTIALFAGAFIDPPEGYWVVLPAYFILLAAGIGAYNWSNLRESQNGRAPR